jgi:hypothetical protein
MRSTWFFFHILIIRPAEKKDWKAVNNLMNEDEFKNVEANLLKLVGSVPFSFLQINMVVCSWKTCICPCAHSVKKTQIIPMCAYKPAYTPQVNGPVLNADDRKTIGTRKRYGIAADVIYGVGGVQSTSPKTRSFAALRDRACVYVCV